jgi:hypothetical protein
MSIASFLPNMWVSRPRPTRLALIVRWRGTQLDRLLAAGASPWASDELTLRARNLTTARSRKRVAGALAGVRSTAEKATPGFTAAVRPRSEDVLEASAVIASIERRLRAPGPVAAQGMAQIRLLLIDGNGPLYRPSNPSALTDCLHAAAAALA